MLEGRQICHYLLLQQIGSGGMGTVYLARDSRVAKVREVAVKIIALSTALKPEELEHKKRLFRREIEAIAHVDHPHILPLFDFGAETSIKWNISISSCRIARKARCEAGWMSTIPYI